MDVKSLHDMLDAFVTRKISVPSHYQVLRLPLIDEWEAGRVRSSFEVDPDLKQPAGSLFGGYLSAVADELMGLAAVTVLDGESVPSTSDLRIQYFRPLVGGKVTVEASVYNRSRSSIHVEASFLNHEGKLAAKAWSVQTLIRIGAKDSPKA